MSSPSDRRPHGSRPRVRLLVRPAKAGPGAAYRGGFGWAMEDWAPVLRIISWAGSAYVRTVLRVPAREATAGFKAFRADALAGIGALSTESDGYCFQIENTWRAARRGRSITEVPVTFSDRTDGASKMSGAIVLEAVVRVLRWRIAELARSPDRIVRAAA
jgi:dolichol-phosphate mannosyltransferase